MELVIIKQAEKELKSAPKDLKEDIYSLFNDLMIGKKLSLPISRPLPTVAKGLHELILSGKSGEFRVFYLIKINDAIYIVHAVSKKVQALDKKTTDLIKLRIARIKNEKI